MEWSGAPKRGGPRSKKPRLPFDEIDKLLRCDPETGNLYWKIERGLKAHLGERAGYRTEKGYNFIQINGRAYPASHLVWLLMTGDYPAEWMDHRDNDRANDRFHNLREATPLENTRNTLITKRNTSGLKGASWYGPTGKWAAKIRVDGRLLHLGYHTTVQQAHAAYVEAARFHFGKFARVA